MQQWSIILVLFLSLLLSGCISDLESPPSEPEYEPLDEVHWERTLENEAVLVRVNATSPMTAYMNVSASSDRPWTVSMTVVGHWPVGFSMGENGMVIVNDQSVDWPPVRPSFQPWPVQRAYDPGQYYIVLDSKSNVGDFTFDMEEGSIEVVAEDPDMVRWHHIHDGEWDERTNVHTPLNTIFQGSKHIALKYDYGQIAVSASSAEYKIQFDNGCQFERGHLDPPGSGSALHNVFTPDSLNVDVEFMRLDGGARVHLRIFDLPIDPPEPDCWSGARATT